MIKFKKGDRVVLINVQEYYNISKHAVGTVLDNNTPVPYVRFDLRYVKIAHMGGAEDGDECIHQDDLEFQSVFKSPLYQALLEDEDE